MFGEVYEVNDSMLHHLDLLEDHPNTYRRSPCHCVMLSNDTDGPWLCPGGQSVLDCEMYAIFGFKPHFLTLPHINSYTNKVDVDGQYRSRDDKSRADGDVVIEIK